MNLKKKFGGKIITDCKHGATLVVMLRMACGQSMAQD
jgi:hypothetical protein